ncbi:Peptide chain release factor 2 [Corynebacterium variabile]
MQPDVTQALDHLDSTLTTIEKVLDLDELDDRVRELEAQAADPSLWDDPDHAQQVTSQLSHVQSRLKKVRGLRSRLDDLPVMYEMADEAAVEDAAEGAEAKELADAELADLRADIESLEVTTMLSGEYDDREAVVNIRSAAGGVDAADWAEMLMRMYTRWAEKNGHKVEVYDISYAEEAGIKSATFVVHGDYMYGTLSVEQGTHRLVRISPFDNQGRRQTSFAEVEVLPVVETSDHVDIDENDVRVDVYRFLRPRWSVGEHDRLRRATDAHPDGHRRDLSEREVADPEQGLGHAGAGGETAGAQATGRGRGDGRAAWRRLQLLG